VRSAVVLVLVCVSGCAAAGSDACESCPSVTLTANGSGDLAAAPGTAVAYAWASEHADSASSTVTISPGPDGCGNTNGPWVVSTLTGTTDPLPLLPCQAGFSYTLAVEVTQDATGATATSTVTIAVQ
jgi:hypothetical protein